MLETALLAGLPAAFMPLIENNYISQCILNRILPPEECFNLEHQEACHSLTSNK